MTSQYVSSTSLPAEDLPAEGRVASWPRLLIAQIPNALVLLVLGGLLFWGHTYHWHIPKFSEIIRPPQKAAQQVDPDDALPGAAELPVLEVGEQMPALKPIFFESVEAIRKSGIEVAAVEERQVVEEVSALGTINYDQTLLAQLSARVSGTVWSVEKKVGEPIKRGEILAVIEALEIGRVKSEFLQAVVSSELREETLARMKHIRSSMSERQVREAEAAAREARIRLFNAQQTLINLGLPVRLEAVSGLHDQELVEHVHYLGLPQSITDRYDPLSTTANLVPIVAPFDGIVIGREIVVGELVEPSNAAQLVVADVRRMWIELDVRKEDASKVRRGQQVTFSIEGVPADVHSKITWISTEVDKLTRMIQARVEVDNPLIHGVGTSMDGQRLLRANMFGVGRIRIEEKPDAIVVPSKAIHLDGAVHVVFVRAGDRMFQPRPVEPGIVDGAYTEVLTGLRPGERVAAAGSHVLKAEIVKQRLNGGGA